MKKIIAVLISMVLLVTAFAGCKKEDKKTIAKEIYKTDFSKYKSSSEIPDWDGEELSIIKWVQATNPTSSLDKSYTLKDDPITKEIKRITGIDYNLDESFDNADSSYDAVIAKLIATDTLPHVAEGIPTIGELVKNGYLWNIEEYLKEYAPTVYEMFGPNSGNLYADLWNEQIKTYGGVYELPFGTSTEPMKALKDAGHIDVDDDTFNKVITSLPAYPGVQVRDDVLKKLYPEAHTVAELEAIYEKNGTFTEEEVFDVPINTPQDFVDMLEKIKALNLKDGKNEVYPTFTHVGMDNWPILQQMGAMFGHTSTVNPSVCYFSYFDKNEGKLKPTYKEAWFKDLLKEYNRWVREGIASEEALVDTNNVFKEKLNNGRYIVCYGSYTPQEAALPEGYRYRAVYAKYKTNTEDALFVGTNYTTYNKYTFFKNTLSEEQLIQVLRMFEFLVSDAGEKLCYWGTEEMGLYTEDENGVLSFKDENIKNQIINTEKYGKEDIVKYGLAGGSAWPGRIMNYASEYYPKFRYADELSTWRTAFSAARFDALETVPGIIPSIYSSDFLMQFDEVQNFWNARNGFENAMLKIFAAGSDAEFEAKYAEMVKYAEDNGLTDEVFEKATKYYKEELNKDYMKYATK